MSIIVDKCVDAEIITELERLNINYYKSCSLDFLYTPVNTHPDMQIHFITDECAVVAPSAYDYYRSVLPPAITLHKGHSDPQSTYPGDCAYNVAKLGKRLLGNMRYIDAKIKEIYKDLNYEFIDVKQGYTKCNLCIIDENSVITEDEGLFRVLKSHEINVLKMSTLSVLLRGFKNGFIGGASGFVSSNTIAFYGNINIHEEKNLIESFIKNRKVDIICLSSTKMQDFGSILYVDDGF